MDHWAGSMADQLICSDFYSGEYSGIAAGISCIWASDQFCLQDILDYSDSDVSDHGSLSVSDVWPDRSAGKYAEVV